MMKKKKKTTNPLGQGLVVFFFDLSIDLKSTPDYGTKHACVRTSFHLLTGGTSK